MGQAWWSTPVISPSWDREREIANITTRLINRTPSPKSSLEIWTLISMEKYISCSTHIEEHENVHNWGGFTSNILHSIYCEIGELCTSFRNHLPHFPDISSGPASNPLRFIPFQEFISFSPFSMVCSLEFGSLLCFFLSWIHYSCDRFAVVHLALRGWAPRTSHCDVGSVVSKHVTGQWGILQLPLRTAPHFPSPTIWAQSRQCPNFRLHSFFSLLILFSVLLSRDEEKGDNRANKASFFISIVLLGCFIMTCQLFNTPESCLWSTKCYSHIIWKCFFSALRPRWRLCCYARRKFTGSLGSEGLQQL